MKKKIFHRLLSCIVTLGLVSCSLLPPEGELTMQSVSIYADLDANENSATAVDLVLVYNQDLVQTLSQMSAAQYFENSRQLLLDNPGLLDIWHWELVPGQIVERFKPYQPKWEAFAAFIFANYLTPGIHRVKVPCSGIVNVLLLRTGLRSVSVSECGPDLRRGPTMSIPSAASGENYDQMCKTRQGQIRGEDSLYMGLTTPTPRPGGNVVMDPRPTRMVPAARSPCTLGQPAQKERLPSQVPCAPSQPVAIKLLPPAQQGGTHGPTQH